MSYQLCGTCITLGYCRKSNTRLVTDKQLENPEYLRDLRAFTSHLNISPDHWRDYLVDTYRDYRGRIVANGQEVSLEMDVFETAGIREWFRDYCRPVPDDVRPRLREESRERIRVLATILSTRFPFATSIWGVRPANDNEPPV